MRGISETIKHLIIINVIFWLATVLLKSSGVDLESIFALHFPKNEQFRPWQIITHMFMHASTTGGGGIIFAHLLFNMFGLWMFGTPLEQMWGRNRFLFFYIFAGVGSAIIYTLMNYYQFYQGFKAIEALGIPSEEIYRMLNETPKDKYLRFEQIPDNLTEGMFASYNTIAVGASGALYGILVAFAMIFPNMELFLLFLPIPIKAKYFVPFLILSDLFFGFTKYSIGPIAHFAHVGGALFGFIMMWYWKKNQFNRNRWD